VDDAKEIRPAMTEHHQPNFLDARLRSVWRRDQVLNRAAGLLAFCRWALLLFLIGMAVDWLVDLPAAGRVGILVILIVVALSKAWQSGWRHLRRFDPSRTALRVEKHHGGLESLLVTAIQLSESGSVAGTSEALCAKTCRLAEEAAGPLRPEDAVSYKGLRRFLLLALIPAVIIGGFAIVDGPFLAAGFGRIFTPWLAIAYPTRTQIALEQGNRIVKEGVSLRLAARIGGEVPDGAELILRTGQGKPRERKLTIVNGVCEYKAEAVFRSFDYRVSAGDAETAWHTVRVISAPRIERAEVTLQFPEYIRRAAKTVEALTLTVPEGTTIQWKLALDRAVDEAEFRPAEGTALPLKISSDGRSVTMEQVAAESRAYSFGWVDKEHEFDFSSPRYYLQVAPDQRPSVDLTSPRGNLFATLERKFDFAFRGRDDHGIGEAAITYRLNKTEEKRVSFPAPELSDGGEERIDWDYREALSDLAIGDTVSFAVELADRYPGPDGPHRVRSDARRVQFLSKEDYLAQIAKQKRRLLTQIRAIYREERGVHALIRDLDPSSSVFVQTCQLEAVRQDLMRERLGVIRARIDALVGDLAANKVSEEVESAALAELSSQLERISDEHVRRAASLLRGLAAVDDGRGKTRNPAPAIDMVNSSARELGLVVLQLGFAEASDVMARELHATAQTQAALRLQTILGEDADAAAKDQLAETQARLARETARLLAATPRNKESTSTDAIVAFKLSRLVNGLVRSGADAKMREAAALVPKAESENAARLQAEVIAALLRAEFRLRIGAEYEALTTARDFFTAQAAEQRQLREESAALNVEEFAGEQSAIAESQSTLQRQLQLLLMPEIPAHRSKLFDAVVPAAPPVNDFLAAAESALEMALAQIESGDREAAAAHQRGAETAFTKLAEITRGRMEAMTEQEQMKASVNSFGKQASQLFMLEERLLVLLEQVEDAADDEVNTAGLTILNQALAEDAEGLRKTIALWNDSQGAPSEDYLPLLDALAWVARAVSAASPMLKDNKPDDAIELQEQALDVIEEAGALIEELTATRSAFASVLENTGSALAPSPLLTEIEDEQARLAAVTEKAEPEDYPVLVIPQKNLIHAVDAVLSSLDPLAHKIESGTVLLFAKEDMDAAAIGLEEDDIEDALDAQSFVVESLQELRAKVDKVTPEYRYIREVTEFLYEVVPQSAVIRTGMRQLQEKGEGVPDAGALKKKAEQFGSDLQKLTGEERYAATASHLIRAIDSAGSESELEEALDALIADIEDLQLLMEHLAYLITPPSTGGITEEPTAEVKMIHQTLSVAAHHKDLSRKTHAAGPEEIAGLAEQQRELANQCKALFPPPAPHPNIAAAHRHFIEAVAKLESGDRDAAITSQNQAADALRYFILEYALKYVDVPPPVPAEDAPPSDQPPPDDSPLELFLPGALTGERPKGGRLEWQVLGRRDRAALNENFARELPLEYRAILKDYYERLTE
jgi:hypothetical protein